MPAEFINRVHVLARRSTAALTFADRTNGEIIPDNDDDDDHDDVDPDYDPGNDSDDDDEDDSDDA